MTRSVQVDSQVFSPFSLWIRGLAAPLNSSNFDCQNLDYVWFAYRQGWLITIEEKRFGARSTEAQNDTHNIIRQLLAAASGTTVKTLRGKRPIEYRGHFVISFEETTPDDSAWVRINGVEYDHPSEVIKTLLWTGKLP